LCSDSWIHFYTNPIIAILMNPAHANFLTPRLWECETSGAELHEAFKSGCKTLTTIKEIPVPEMTEVQRIAFEILCAKEIYHNEKWNSWADKWLSGEDRSNESAITARAVSATAAAAEAASATWAAWAAWAAANAAHGAAYAAWTAHAASSAAVAYWAAYWAAETASTAANAATWATDANMNHSIDFIKLAEKALTYK
jgi:hypothetical protein